MKKNILLWGIAVLLIITAFFVTNKNNLSNNNTNQSSTVTQNQRTDSNSNNTILIDAKLRQQALDFTLTDLNGNKVSLKDLKGKNVYINFWTTWCSWCKKEMPDIEKVYQDYKDKNLVILAVNMGEDKITVDSYIKQSNYHFNVLLDSDQSIAQKYNISSIPVSIFIDTNGNIAQNRIGAMSEDQMKSIINALIK